jgi:putative membrane protein
MPLKTEALMKRVLLSLTAVAVAATMIGATPEKITNMPSPDIAAVLVAANQGEIDQSDAAYSRLQASSAKNFAQMMVDDHKRALTTTTSLMTASKIVANDAAKDAVAIRDNSKKLVTSFAAAKDNLDRAYMAAQIEEHQQLLVLLDQKMIPSAKGAILTLLQNTRFTVQAHLDRAKAIMGEK